jgi:hypothetical protein
MVDRAIVVDPFCLRQFEAASGKTPFIGCTVEEFEKHVHDIWTAAPDPQALLQDGYAPFCKHVFIPNFVGATVSVLPITAANEAQLRSGYSARTEKELPVLTRWFPANIVGAPPAAKFLDLILYSRGQIRKENEAMGEDSNSDAPWGIVSIKAQDVDSELPMQPITVMRNALGEDQGGSGVGLVAESYRASVEYWSANAPIQ